MRELGLNFSRLTTSSKSPLESYLPPPELQAANAAKIGQPIVDIRRGTDDKQPAYFAVAFVPVVINGQTVATVADFVDETAHSNYFYGDALLASVALCGLTGLGFFVPAVAWYRRTREKQQADRRIKFLAHHD